MKKKYLILYFLISLVGACIFTFPALAVEDEDITYPTVSREKYPRVAKEPAIAFAPLETGIDKLDIDLSASVICGYDTNVKLQHYDPASSVFIQEAFGAKASYPLARSCTLRGEYDLTSIKYFRFSEPDLLDNIIKAGFDADIVENLLWSVDYTIDFVGFPHDKKNEYTMHAVETGLRHDITNWLYQKLIYEFSYRHYPKLKTRNRGGAFRLGDREDTRNTLEHQLGLYLTDKTLIRADNTLYFNNSNELYLDYYDYTAFKTKGTVLHLITEKLYGSVNIGYQYKRYHNRVVSDRVEGDQRDHLLMAGTAFFYDITPVISIGASFDYRRNLSNEGAQKYKDYIISGGLYSKF